MKGLKIAFGLFLFVLLFIGGTVGYAFKVAPYRLTIKEYELNQKQKETQEIKIVQFSDVHIKKDFSAERLEKVVNKINEEKPDIVFFTGDLYDNFALYHEYQAVTAELAKIQAKIGKFSVWGNRDYGGGAAQSYTQIMQNAGFQLLKNETTVVSTGSGKNVSITGLDDQLLGQPIQPVPEQADVSLLLAHEPEMVDQLTTENYRYIFSGHSHGGQLNVPFFPSVNRRLVDSYFHSTKYIKGAYSLNSGSTLYVDSGIGTTHVSARLGVLPQISVYHLYL